MTFANFLTVCRILCGLALLCFPADSAPFLILYLLAGVTDMTDGTVARLTHTAGETGARLDTAADLIFALCAFGKLLPTLTLPPWIWISAAMIALLKLWNMLLCLRRRCPVELVHTVTSKLTGLALFCFPLAAVYLPTKLCAAAVCLLALIAAVQEHLILLTRSHSSR